LLVASGARAAREIVRLAELLLVLRVDWVEREVIEAALPEPVRPLDGRPVARSLARLIDGEPEGELLVRVQLRELRGLLGLAELVQHLNGLVARRRHEPELREIGPDGLGRTFLRRRGRGVLPRGVLGLGERPPGVLELVA